MVQILPYWEKPESQDWLRTVRRKTTGGGSASRGNTQSYLIWTNQIQVVYMSHIQDFIYLPEIVHTLLGQSVHLEHMLLHIFTNGNIHMPNKIMGRGA